MKKKQKKGKALLLSDTYQGVAISLLVDVVCLFIVGLFAIRGYYPKIFMLPSFFYLSVLHLITALIIRFSARERGDLVRGAWIVFWLFPLFFLFLFLLIFAGSFLSAVFV